MAETTFGVEDLKTTWRTAVRLRNVAMDNDDFDRIAIYSQVAEDTATMIEQAGVELPKVEDE